MIQEPDVSTASIALNLVVTAFIATLRCFFIIHKLTYSFELKFLHVMGL